MSDENERMIAALLRERAGARNDEHRDLIDEQLRLRGYDVDAAWPKTEPQPSNVPPRNQAPKQRSSKPRQKAD